MKTMIALVGEQPQPNFLPVLHYNPDYIVFIYSDRTEQYFSHLKEEIQMMNGNAKTIQVHGVKTDAYNIATIVTDLNNKLTGLPTPLSPQSLIFNLTGGTKPMSLAAHQVAVQYNAPVIYLQSEKGQSIIDLYVWQDHKLFYQNSEVLVDKHMSLHTVLNLQLGREVTSGKAAWEEKGPKQTSDSGHLFELAIAEALKKHGYETMCGVHNHNNNMDIDVLIRYQNHISIIEAKIGKAARDLKGIQQLSTAMRYIRGTYTKQFLVLNAQATNDQKVMCGILNITVIPLLHYQKDMTSLSSEDVETLLNAIDTITKVK